MRVVDLPEWVLKYKKPGHSIYLRGKNFCLYKVTSKYIPGEKYPKSIHEFVGVIDKEKGVIPKKTHQSYENLIEYGLSYFIYKNYKRELERSCYGAQNSFKELPIKLAIVKYVHGFVSDSFLMESYISKSCFDEIKKIRDSLNINKLTTLTNKIDILLNKDFKDKEELAYVKTRLRSCLIKDEKDIENYKFPDDLKDLITSKGLKL